MFPLGPGPLRVGVLGDGSIEPSLAGVDAVDRPLEVLRTALSAGYFEWPRENDGEYPAGRVAGGVT